MGSLAVVFALVTLLALRFDVDWSSTGKLIRNSNPWWFALALAVHYTTFLFRGARWRLLLLNVARDDVPAPRPPSTLHCGAIILMGWFANSVSWFRLGDAYRAYAYADDTGTSFSRTMGTVVADRLVDLSVVLTMMAVGATILYVGGQVRPSPLFVLIATALLLAGLAGLLGMFLLRRWVAPRLSQRVQGAYHRFHTGTMGSFRRLHLVFLLGILGWLAEVGRLFFVLKALGITVSLGLVLFVPMANGLLTAVPLTPGGLGIVEPGITGLLMLQSGRALKEAAAIALLDRSISYLSIVAVGGIAFAIRHVRVARRALTDPRVATR
jgi:uncharacterized protein (TIRG00374 family)